MMDWRFDQRSELHEHEHKPCHSSSSSIDAKVRSQSRLAGAYLTDSMCPMRLMVLTEGLPLDGRARIPRLDNPWLKSSPQQSDDDPTRRPDGSRNSLRESHPLVANKCGVFTRKTGYRNQPGWNTAACCRSGRQSVKHFTRSSRARCARHGTSTATDITPAIRGRVGLARTTHGARWHRRTNKNKMWWSGRN